jgi:hypothetical protein
MKIGYFIALCTLSAAILFSCKHEPPMGSGDGNGGGTDTTGNTRPCDPDSVYFNKDILPLIIQSCAKSGCHDQNSAADGVILTNYQNIISTGNVVPGNPGNSELYDVITETDPAKIMPPPPAGPLTADQKALIYKWIMQSAKNNYCGEACDTTQFTYSGTISSIISRNCIGCHTGSSPGGGISLNTYDEVKAQCVNGKMLPAITKTGPKPMPPSASSKLSDCNITQVTRWINNNYPQ